MCLIFGFISTAVFAQYSMGAKGLGLGQATTSIHGYEWALFGNPALVSNAETAVGFYGLRNYGFAEITDMAAVGSMPTALGVFSGGFHRYGDHLFNETRIRVGYKNEWKMLHLGIVANYNTISFGKNYGSGSAIGIDAGIAAKITDSFWMGAKSTNLNRPKYKGIREDLPRELSLGFSYHLNDLAMLTADAVKDVNFPLAYRGGVEVKVIDALKGRVGITTEPLSYSLGFGYRHTRWDVNFAVQKHQLLGFSPGLDFMIFF